MQKILFIELLGGLGDALIALPAVQALAASHPQAQLTVLTFAPGDSLLRHHPLIQRVWQAPKGQARGAVIEALRESFDLVVTDTTYDGIAELVEQSGADRTVANLWRSPPSDQLVSDRFLQILQAESLIAEAAAQQHRHPQIHLTKEEHRRVQTQLGTVGYPWVGLYPDAGMAIKQWSPERFIELGRRLQERYGASLIIPEGADREQVAAIATQLEGSILWPRGALRELAALFAQLDCVVAADTGPARIAAAVGTPTITLFGPSWHGRYGQPSPHINLQGYLPCPERNIANFTEQTCWYSGTCPFAWDTCVNLVSAERVAGVVGEVLEGEMGRWGDEAVRSRGDEVVENSKFKIPCGKGKALQNSKFITPHRQVLRTGYTNTALPPYRPPSFTSLNNLLVIRLDNIGDVIMTSPALRAIKETSPNIRLTLMASPAGALTAPLLPWVDEVLPWRTLWQALGKPPGDVAQEWQLIETLNSRQFDGAIVLTSFKQSPHPAAFICQMAGIPLRLGASKETGECLTHRIGDIPDDLHQADRNLKLVEAAGFRVQNRQLSVAPLEPLSVSCRPTKRLRCSSGAATRFMSPSETPQATPWAERESKPSAYLLLNPWTSCPSRMYSLERFAIAARTLSEKTGFPVVVTGTDQNRAAAKPLLENLGDCAIDLIGQTTLPELASLVAHARLMLSNNTSTMHIADATQTPSVILFAGTELERQWQPRQTRARLLRRPTLCSPCYAFSCPYEMECLDIPPEAVVEAGMALLSEVQAANFEF